MKVTFANNAKLQLNRKLLAKGLFTDKTTLDEISDNFRKTMSILDREEFENKVNSNTFPIKESTIKIKTKGGFPNPQAGMFRSGTFAKEAFNYQDTNSFLNYTNNNGNLEITFGNYDKPYTVPYGNDKRVNTIGDLLDFQAGRYEIYGNKGILSNDITSIKSNDSKYTVMINKAKKALELAMIKQIDKIFVVK